VGCHKALIVPAKARNMGDGPTPCFRKEDLRAGKEGKCVIGIGAFGSQLVAAKRGQPGTFGRQRGGLMAECLDP